MCSTVSLLYCLLILLSINITVVTSAEANKTEIDRQALLCFKSGISSDPLGVLNSWRNTSRNFCNWSAVTCDVRHPIRVVSIDLTSMHLTGQISGCIANLTSLSQIHLADNSLSGAIPDELGMLPGLQTLMLAGNHLEGNIPDSLGSSMSLSYVNLANNSLTGSIPHSLASSSSLSTLILSRNSLTGEIPANLFYNSSALTTVDLQMNSFTGVIPPFDKVTALKNLCVTENFLSGGIPPSIGNISSLRFVLLGQNLLTGSVPESLGHISELFELDLSFNSLSGYVPMPLYNLSSLKYISLGSNRLVGQLPSYIGYSLPSLQVLIMQSNNLEGLIPASLENASNLQVLDLSNNSLYGRIPSLGSLAKLRQVLLGRNQLEVYDWQFLVSLTNCAQLKKLSLEGNMMNGSLPGSIGNLSTSLEYLLLGSNQISGSIPVEISNLVNLTMLSMENNFLSGSIPDKIGKLRNLFILNLSKNKLSGQIPSTVGNIAQLNQLYLDDNMLSGHIPASLGQCTRLAMLNLSVNNLDGSIPSEIFSISSLSLGLDLSNNNLTGTIPVGIGKLINLGLLNVSSNKLSGEIPSELGQCVLLSSLQMEGNMLSGVIPQSLNTLKSIQQMDLSENNLSGYIPDFFENFKTLYHLNLSYNKLEGPIPTGGIFTNSNAVMLEGNKGLCQQIDIFALPICPITSSTKRKINGRLLLITVPPVTIALLSFLCVVTTIMKGRTIQPSESYRETMKKVSYGDILKATNWFSPVNRISSSHTASVYIGRFQFDTDLVAIKVFHLDEQGSLNSFFTECEVLKHTRHRNLVQAITLCSTVDFENNEFKALVYEFMANGSLDMWIHPRLHQRSPRRVLSLGQRISIAADVASALDYMHNQLTPPLIHCDLKPSNVLLDYDMTSRIGDFGSAKFLSSSLNSTPEGLVGASGTIGYIAPEYGMGCKISTGGDVYGFGVLLLEMLTAKRPTDRLFGNDLSLHKYVDLAFPNKINEILDPQMPHEDVVVSTLCMQRYIIPLVEIGLMCTMESPKDRPGMQDVCAKLEAIKEAFVETF